MCVGFAHVSQSNSRGQKLEGLNVKPSGLVAIAFTHCASHQPSLFLGFFFLFVYLGLGVVLFFEMGSHYVTLAHY